MFISVANNEQQFREHPTPHAQCLVEEVKVVTYVAQPLDAVSGLDFDHASTKCSTHPTRQNSNNWLAADGAV